MDIVHPFPTPKELSGDWRLRSHTPLLTQNHRNSGTISFQTPAWAGRATSRKGPDGRVKGQTWLQTRLVVDGSTSPERPSLSSKKLRRHWHRGLRASHTTGYAGVPPVVTSSSCCFDLASVRFLTVCGILGLRPSPSRKQVVPPRGLDHGDNPPLPQETTRRLNWLRGQPTRPTDLAMARRSALADIHGITNRGQRVTLSLEDAQWVLKVNRPRSPTHVVPTRGRVRRGVKRH
jgi:hypothetical protein